MEGAGGAQSKVSRLLEEPIEGVWYHVDMPPSRSCKLVVNAAGRAIAARQRPGKNIPGVDVATGHKSISVLAIDVLVKVRLRACGNRAESSSQILSAW